MKIAIFSSGVIPAVHYGGTERIVQWLLQELVAMGHTVTLLGPEGCTPPVGVEFIPVPMPEGNINENPIDLRPFLPAGTEILHLFCAANFDYGLPVLKTVQGYPFHRTGEFFAHREQFDADYAFISNAHRCICGRPDNPFVYNGIDLNEYEFRAKKDDFFLFIGKVDWNVKGLGIALRVANERGLRLVIAGDFLDPNYYERELKHILNDRISYAGPVGGTVKRELLAAARAMLFPTMWPEPFGIVVPEALASGTPVITSFNGAMPEIMVQGMTGWMADTVPEMVAAVDHLEGIDPAFCRSYVEANFSSRLMAARYVALYEMQIAGFKG
jgi:glycosyltransferase involved in cell wall biosynthesis